MSGEEKSLLPSVCTKHEKISSLQSVSYGTNDDSSFKTVPSDDRLMYTWSDLNVFMPERIKVGLLKRAQTGRKHILKNVSGIAYPGEVLAILGPSGAGKTTLLNALTFRLCPKGIVAGLRCANGVPLSQTTLTSQSAYVQQDDLFFVNLTVKEHLIFHSLVRMDRRMPYKGRANRVDEVISELSLKKCENVRIGYQGDGISGGERKRLAFASEVLTDPPLMFCDEPTSGLDSFMALNVVQVLKNMAKSGKTVVCTIHQPSSELYGMFDKVLFLSEGRTAFLGTPDEADLFFSSLNAPCPRNYNPADYYIQLLAVIPDEEESSRQAIDMICANFEKSEFGQKLGSAVTHLHEADLSYNDFWAGIESDVCPYKASSFSQFRAVLWRSWISVRKDSALTKVRILQTIMIAFVIGLIYFGQELNQDGVMNINGAMFIFLTSMTFQNIYSVVNVFCADFPVFLREHTNGMYRTDIYFLGKTLAELPIFTCMPLLYISVCYYMIGLNPDVYRFLTAAVVLVLVANVATSFGYLISCATRSESMAMALGPPLIIPFLLFGGFFLNVSSIPIYFKWLSYFSWFRYGNEALMINQWSNIDAISCPELSTGCPKSGDVVLKMYNFSKDDLNLDMIMLFSLIIIFRICAFFALLFRTFRRD